VSSADSIPDGQDEGGDSTELAEVQAIYCLGYVREVRPVPQGRVGLIPKG
jgi:hypothetical protein